MSVNDGGPLFGSADADALQDLARHIREAHRRCESALRKSVQAAADVGGLLRQAKGRVQHGRWVAWVRGHCPFGVRTAQNYMKVAERLPDMKTQRVSLLSLRETLALLAEKGRGDEERQAVLADLGVPAVKELLGAMGAEPDGNIKTAAETGWATDRYWLDKLTPEERHAFNELPAAEHARPMSAGTIEQLLPGPDAPIVPIRRVGRRFDPKGKADREAQRLGPLVLVEAEDGQVIPVAAESFRLLRRRHKGAALAYDPDRRLLVFRQEGEVVAMLTPRCAAERIGGPEPVEAVRARLTAIREQLGRVEEASGSLGQIEAAQTVLQLDKVVSELEATHP